jgi:pyridoxal phosphate enzyme (YggS family)
VGHLQSNKVRSAVALFGTIHSADSLDLLGRIDRIAHDEGRSPRVLLQVNVSGEPTKSGFEVNWFADQAVHRDELVARLAEIATARVVGLMTIAPEGASPTAQHAVFATLRRLRDGLQETIGRALPELSMGMTADAEAAVAEGATLVRIGTALFGPRPHPA